MYLRWGRANRELEVGSDGESIGDSTKLSAIEHFLNTQFCDFVSVVALLHQRLSFSLSVPVKFEIVERANAGNFTLLLWLHDDDYSAYDLGMTGNRPRLLVAVFANNRGGDCDARVA
ncbi:hypothetical protein L2E82_11296 [Cichorium intybus]|uniref:Uncharacterized protein n=1 Tax=Cichorium intybus TaxID=13427 RepID=A0ACB9GEX0_CICIN|nr:hypothetical protein L2E82_11296 [Cichorium intybus]